MAGPKQYNNYCKENKWKLQREIYSLTIWKPSTSTQKKNYKKSCRKDRGEWEMEHHGWGWWMEEWQIGDGRKGGTSGRTGLQAEAFPVSASSAWHAAGRSSAP
jgi:hypothetical protein